ncbi:MAG: hypothetical protein Q4E62_06910 [Sutterellaceae bacterium]|nr:hypothetical protein [Sutterellaceae bacterium]
MNLKMMETCSRSVRRILSGFWEKIAAGCFLPVAILKLESPYWQYCLGIGVIGLVLAILLDMSLEGEKE